jgi:transcriptional regulator with XRE-family HTH domain
MKAEESGAIIESFSQRLKGLRKELRLNQKEFAWELQLSDSYICQVENGKIKPGFEFFYKLVNRYNINLKYLFFGQGEMFLKEEEPGSEEEEITDIETLSDLVRCCEQSPIFNLNILGYAARYFYEHESVIKENIKRHRELKEKGR